MQIDVIMLSFTKDNRTYNMTRQAIDSLHKSEKDIDFNIYLIETNDKYLEEGYVYEDAYVACPREKFNYNRFLNFGYELTQYTFLPSEYTLITNNDVIFHPGWFSEILAGMRKYNLDSASALNPGWQYHAGLEDKEIVEGFDIGREFCGWNLVYKRESLDKLMPLDEDFVFWCQDDMLAFEMKNAGMKHALIPSAKVTHLTSQSHHLIPPELQHYYTHGMGEVRAKKMMEWEKKQTEIVFSEEPGPFDGLPDKAALARKMAGRESGQKPEGGSQ